MPTVQGSLSDAGIADVEGAQVAVQLVASTSDPNAPGFLADNTSEIFSPKTFATDSTGAWSADLTANSLIVPAGTVYKVNYLSGPYQASFYIRVPDAAGPFWVGDLLAAAPVNLADAQPATLLIRFTKQGPVIGPWTGGSPARVFGNGWRLDQVAADLDVPLLAGDSPLVLDLNVNGTTVWTTQANRLTIEPTESAAVTTTFNVVELGDGDLITFDIDSGLVAGTIVLSVYLVNLTADGGVAPSAGEPGTIVIQSADTTVVSSASTIDFSADFDVTPALGDEANIAIGTDIARAADVTDDIADEATARDAAIAAHAADSTLVHGIVDASLLETAAGAQGKVDTHINWATDAHDATAISFTPAGTIAATDVQAAIEEVATEAAAGAGAPSTVDYLVGTADAGLSAEIVVGTSPGGELGGTWASPTVDATHSGSSHAGIQSAAEATAAAALVSHEADTTSIHGIANTANLETTSGAQTKVDTHVNDTSAAHAASTISADSTTLVGTGTDVQAVLEELDNGIADHLADTADAHAASAITNTPAGTIAATTVQAALNELDTEKATTGSVTSAVAAHEADTTSVHGIADTSVLATATSVATAVSNHEADTTSVHGITDTSALVVDGDAAGGDLSGTYPSPSVVDDSHAHTGTTISALDAADTTSGTFAIGRLASGTPDGTKFVRDDGTLAIPSGTGAPTDVNYLVGTASGGLSAEIVVGATPGGELGNTWASPTVDATHSGSSHAAVQAAAEATAQAALDAHIADTGDAHDASAISILDTANDFTATDVEGALAELQTADEADEAALAAHIADTSAAHAASAISADSTTLVGTGTDVQAVLEELDNGIADHLADSSAAHAASAVSFAPTGTIAATDAQAAVAEVATDAASALTTHEADTSTHGVGEIVGRTETQTLTGKTVDLTSNTLVGSVAEFNAALESADFATLAGTETLTGKTVALGSNTVSGTLAQFNTAVTDADIAPIASPTFTGTATAPFWVPSGLTGATAASRYVGGTTSGAPASGTFAVGDYVIAQDGGIWICTGAGSPGTWFDMSSGRELGRAQITTTITTTNVGAANRTDATGLIITVTVGTRPILLEFWGIVANSTASDGIYLALVEAAAGATNTPILTRGQYINSIAAGQTAYPLAVPLSPSAGSHTYKLMFAATVGGTANIVCASDQPAWIRAINA